MSLIDRVRSALPRSRPGSPPVPVVYNRDRGHRPDIVPAILASCQNGEVVLAPGVPLDGIRLGFDPGDGECRAAVCAVREMEDGSMHVIRLESAQPAGWLTDEQIEELRRRALPASSGHQVAIEEAIAATGDETLAVMSEIGVDKRRQNLDPFGPDYWAEVDAAGELARSQQETAAAADAANPDAGPLDPEGASIMTMHHLPAGADPMVTACCGRYVEDIPAVEGFVRTAAAASCPRAPG